MSETNEFGASSVPMRSESLPLSGRSVFLSSGIPNPSQWTGAFEPMEIAHTVVACARAVLSVGGTLLTAAHPTIAPLLLYLAREFPQSPTQPPSIIIYQTRLFQDRLPRETYDMAEGGLADVRWTPAAVDGDPEVRATWGSSLTTMRTTMLQSENLAAAVFIGGMDGISAEHNLVSQLHPELPVYALPRPGGEAAALLSQSVQSLQDVLASELSYPTIFLRVIADILARTGP